MNLLIVDDDKNVLEILNAMIVPSGYYCSAFDNPLNALEEFKRKHYDILITDIQMGKFSGIDLIRSVRMIDKKVKTIVITGFDDFQMAVEALNNGVTNILSKPIDFAHLMDILDSFNEELHIKEELNEKEKKLNEYMLKLEDNINQAKYFQTKFLMIKSPKFPYIRFSQGYRPCDEVGGDIYNIVKKEEGIVFYLADIAGHGVFASIISSFIKARMDDWIINHNIIGPKELVLLLKKTFLDNDILNEMILTVFIGTLNTVNRSMRYISAGHVMPLILEMDKSNPRQVFLDTGSTIVSTLIDKDDYEEGCIEIKQNTKILLYSDGLLEFIMDGRVFGRKRFEDYFITKGISAQVVDDFIERVISDRQRDDIAYLVININNKYEKIYTGSPCKKDVIIDDFREELKERYEMDKINLPRILNCFDEILLNAIEHGGVKNLNCQIMIKALFKKKYLILFVQDSGLGFDWKNIDTCTPPPVDEKRSRGIFMINYFSERIRYNDKGNALLVKLKVGQE